MTTAPRGRVTREAKARSLAQLHPRRLDQPALVLLAAALLAVGLSLPFMRIEKLVFWEDNYSLLDSVVSLWQSGHYLLAAIIFFFSIVFPFCKLTALLIVWFLPSPHANRRRLLRVLGLMGKWSMLDVFVVALLIVLTRARSLLNAEPRAGVYLFAAAIVVSMIASFTMERIAERTEQQDGEHKPR